jgi:cytochrome P450
VSPEAPRAAGAAPPPAGFAIPRPPAGRSLADSLKARLAGPLLLRAVFHLLRRFAPVAKLRGNVIVARHADVVDVLERDGEFSVAATNGAKMDRLGASFILGMDPGERYRRERSWLDRCILPTDHPRIRALVRARCEALLDAARPAGSIDAGGEYARAVAITLVQDYFGVPGPDPATLMTWMRRLFQDLFLNLGDDPAVHARAAEAARGLESHLRERIAALRAEGPRPESDSVLARLVRLSAEDATLDDDGIRRSISGIIVGAVDTTNKAFCQALDELLRRPAVLDGLRAAAQRGDVDEVARGVFEALRFQPHNPIIVRTAARDAAVAPGTPRERAVPAGSTVWAATLSAMFDPAAFPEPGRFRTDRDTPYLHFGGGLHRCYGAPINAITLPELAAALLRRPGLRRAGWLAGRLRYDGPFPDRLEVRFGG